jgi:S-adenosylmethionine synthetase
VKVTDVLISTQHSADVDRDTIRNFLATTVIPQGLDGWYHDDLNILVNPTGSFVQGGPSADAGVTGRKIIVDTYGGMGRHGGGAFSGKDPSKVDRSGAYFCRWVARRIVKEGLAREPRFRWRMRSGGKTRSPSRWRPSAPGIRGGPRRSCGSSTSPLER